MTTYAPERARHGVPVRRPLPRVRRALLVVLAFAHPVVAVGYLMSEQGSCRTPGMCRARTGLILLTFFGGALALAVATWAWRRSSARGAWVVNGALAFSVLLLAAFPAYAPYREGLDAATAAGRENLHAQGRGHVVEVVDATLREVVPGLPRAVQVPAGTRQADRSRPCVNEAYTVRIAPTVSGNDAVVTSIAERWRRLGMDVERTLYGVAATDGAMRFAVDVVGAGPLDVSGYGPCVRP
jgi:hypothetical protein